MKFKSKVVGPRIKIEVFEQEMDKTASGIYIAKNIDETYKENNEKGTVIELGHTAYIQFEVTGPWCKVGDQVLFQRYAGKPLEEMDAEGKLHFYRIIKDVDVIAVLEDVEEDKENV